MAQNSERNVNRERACFNACSTTERFKNFGWRNFFVLNLVVDSDAILINYNQTYRFKRQQPRNLRKNIISFEKHLFSLYRRCAELFLV